MRRPEPVMAHAEAQAPANQNVAEPAPDKTAVKVSGGDEDVSPRLPIPEPDASPPATAAAEAPAPAPRHDPVEPAPAAAAPASASPTEEFVHYPDSDYEAPIKPRRNPAKLWTMAAVAFFVVVSVAGGALAYFGAPSWAVNLGLGTRGDEEGLNFYLPKPPERRNLPTGEEYFAFSARILNDSNHELPVPPVVVELRDDQGRLVFSWMTKADKARLKPNEEARVSESRLDIPKNARNLELRFVDSAS